MRAKRTRPGKWRARCPECGRPRIVHEGRFTVIHDCKCGTKYRVECTGEINRL